MIADKGYDADDLVVLLQQRKAEVVIPSRANRKAARPIDEHLYKERHLIECCIGKLKHFRRVFSRFDKLAKNYLSLAIVYLTHQNLSQLINALILCP